MDTPRSTIDTTETYGHFNLKGSRELLAEGGRRRAAAPVAPPGPKATLEMPQKDKLVNTGGSRDPGSSGTTSGPLQSSVAAAAGATSFTI